MRLEISVEINGTLSVGDAALLMIEAPSGDGQRVVSSDIVARDGTYTRLAGPPMGWVSVPGAALAVHYKALVEVTRPPFELGTLSAVGLQDLPGDVLPYLRPSRYGQADLFTDFAQQQFGALVGGAKVEAIRDWIRRHMAYTPGSSDATTTAVETFASLQGVCRDFAHLLCTLTRASGIPARYASVYGADVTPQDFHAIAQVWLEGAWYPVDATAMGAAHEMAVIAVGRDAADVAFMETARWAHLSRQSVQVRRV